MAPDPIVETRTVTRLVCPAELSAPTPAPVPPYAGPAVDVPAELLSWYAAHFLRERLLAARLDDGREQCPK